MVWVTVRGVGGVLPTAARGARSHPSFEAPQSPVAPHLAPPRTAQGPCQINGLSIIKIGFLFHHFVARSSPPSSSCSFYPPTPLSRPISPPYESTAVCQLPMLFPAPVFCSPGPFSHSNYELHLHICTSPLAVGRPLFFHLYTAHPPPFIKRKTKEKSTTKRPHTPSPHPPTRCQIKEKKKKKTHLPIVLRA